jgi:hypothetical protein
MRRLLFLLLLAGIVLPAFAVEKATTEKVTVAQLQHALASVRGKTDAEVAQRIAVMELTERLSTAALSRLDTGLPGEKARQTLLILADSSAFLDPPAAEIPADPMPDAAETRTMLVAIVNYVNTTVRQLPNLIAERDTTGFEDRPQEDVQAETGLTTLIYLPMHFVGKSGVLVTYRDRREVVDEKAAKVLKHGPQIGGLATSGEFGPILGRVLGDAIQGKITWGRWEKGGEGKQAVFHYAVPREKSHYDVQFCCVVSGYSSTGLPETEPFKENAAYHGEIAFDPANGTILRITAEADLLPNELVSRAGMLVEYAPVEIGGKTFVCPAKSVSILLAHTAAHVGAYSRSNYKGSAKTFLNDVVFGQYRRFGSETRILTVDSAEPNQSSGPATADAPYAAPPRAPTH